MKTFYFHDDNILFLLASAHWKLNRVLKDRFKKENFLVSPEQWLVLLNLMHSGGMTQKELARAQFKDKSAIKRLLDHLEDNRLVHKKKSKEDLRKNQISLSKKGKKLILEMNEVAQEAFHAACIDLKEVELTALKRLITRLEET